MVERLKEIWLDAKQMRDERGLTLIELLVVVVILGIIAAIAVVAIGGLIENSRKDAVVSDAKQLISASKLYTSANPVKSGSSIKLGVYRESNPFVAGSNEAKMDEYIDDMKDPFNGDAAYKDAYVTVTAATNGKYTYTVTLKGDKDYFTNEAPSYLKRDNVTKSSSASE
ncbi:prepilin-type N-terminal cleavage/methylation domain-containing protein [Exiguobacterium sp. BRG2]|uniref:type II secretion system protein n=1 Tax=Exiguobacterium sp. BRG2 TaxID=2962584 RepID=UPI00288259E6|nr:prepilin-type N-terminal cleavage/methylation domain-containing protein [Exiguobacterium sp. BRG2]MDT0172581.1 prepilin-type N-terminal cleavage/methylation domain-containing protein [Exiguobacterium sp. BRG2]